MFSDLKLPGGELKRNWQFWSREAVEKLSGNSGWLCIIRSGSKA